MCLRGRLQEWDSLVQKPASKCASDAGVTVAVAFVALFFGESNFFTPYAKGRAVYIGTMISQHHSIKLRILSCGRDRAFYSKDFPISICLVLEVRRPGLMETER